MYQTHRFGSHHPTWTHHLDHLHWPTGCKNQLTACQHQLPSSPIHLKSWENGSGQCPDTVDLQQLVQIMPTFLETLSQHIDTPPPPQIHDNLQNTDTEHTLDNSWHIWNSPTDACCHCLKPCHKPCIALLCSTFPETTHNSLLIG